MRAKICGITKLEDALFAVSHGVWALGFNFCGDSPRCISEDAAKGIIEALPKNVIKVGIFVNEMGHEVVRKMEAVGLDFGQVYGDVDVELCYKRKMILALQAASRDELPAHEVMGAYGYILLDAPKAKDGLFGGTGRLANWELAAELAKEYKLILAGGLNGGNVAEAIRAVRPFAVDVASGVEASPGVKSEVLVKEFLTVCDHEK